MTDFRVDPSLLEAEGGPLLIAVAGSQTAEVCLAPHRHRRGQLLGSTRGLLSIEAEGKIWVVPITHAVWLPPGKVHAIRSHGPFHGWSVFVAPTWCSELPTSACTIPASSLLREAVRRAAAWPLGDLDLRSSHIATVILDEVGSFPVEQLGLPIPADTRLNRIARQYLADPSDSRSLGAWARVGGVSTRTLSRLFVSETGLTFTAWRQRARLLRALEMLAEETDITTIAVDLGYSTTSAFIRLFRETFGETPARYRSQT